MKNSRGRMPLWFWILLAALALGFAFALDDVVAHWSLLLQTPTRTGFMKAVSHWCDGFTFFLAGVFGTFICFVIGNRRWTIIFAVTALACLLAGALHPVLKYSTGRARPAVVSAREWNGPSMSAKYQSFPSGHTISSVAFVSALLCARRRLGIFLLPLPAIVAASRLYLNAHHFSDVVAGALLGFGCGWVAWNFFAPRLEHARWLRG